MRQKDDFIYEVLDSNTGEWVNYVKTLTWRDGTTITTDNEATYIDNVIYIKLKDGFGGGYAKRVLKDGYVNIDWWGATPNESSSAVAIANMIALRKAINTCGRVRLKGTYYFNKGTSGTTHTITNTVFEIVGEDDAHMIFIGGASVLFPLPASMELFKIDGVTIDNQTVGNLLFIYNVTFATSIDHFVITNNVFNGSPMTFRVLNPFDLDNIIGFQDGIIANNVFNGVGMNFFAFGNCAFETFYVTGNRIYDMVASFLLMEVDNSGSTGIDIINAQKRFIIEYNTIINASDTVIEEYDGGLYLIFIMAQSLSCEYRYNHMEGVKILVPIELYDIYMTSLYGVYENNTFKNNLCFNPLTDESSKALFKGKNVGIRKVCQHNNFIIEEDFVRDILQRYPTMSIEDTWVTSVSFTIDNRYSNCSAIIRNNIFDVFHLKHTASGGMAFLMEYVEFSGNKWRVNKMDSDAFLFIKQSTVLGTDRRVVFERNTITKYGDEAFALGGFLRGNGSYTPGTSDRQFLTLRNNTIYGWSGVFVDFITLQDVDVSGNTAVNESDGADSNTILGMVTVNGDLIARLNSFQAISQSDSTAIDIAGLKTDFNALLEKLRTAGILNE